MNSLLSCTCLEGTDDLGKDLRFTTSLWLPPLLKTWKLPLLKETSHANILAIFENRKSTFHSTWANLKFADEIQVTWSCVIHADETNAEAKPVMDVTFIDQL